MSCERKLICKTCIEQGNGIALTQLESLHHKDMHPDHEITSIEKEDQDNGV
jgi:hypothetical protein